MTQNKPKLNVTCILDLLENASVQDLDRLGEEPIVFARELKLVIQGLLEEIENLKDWDTVYQDYVISLEDVKELIKKWFGDVVEENAKRKD